MFLLIDIGPIFEISQIYSTDLRDLSVSVFSKNTKNVDLENNELCKLIFFKNESGLFLDSLEFFEDRSSTWEFLRNWQKQVLRFFFEAM